MNSRLAHHPPQPGEQRMIRRVLRLPEVIALVGLCKSQIYALMKLGLFPTSIKIGRRAVGWFQDEILHYLETRPRSGNGSKT